MVLPGGGNAYDFPNLEKLRVNLKFGAYKLIVYMIVTE
jgi:hypothetical protein